MYNRETLRRKIAKDGLQETIKLISSEKFPQEIKDELAKDGCFVGGYPNLSFICTL